MATKEQNLESLNNALSTLNQIATNPSTPRNIRKNITLPRRYTDALQQRKKKKNKVRQRIKAKKEKIKKPRKTAWSKKSR